MAGRSSEVALRFSAEKAEAVRNAFTDIARHGSSAARRLVQDNSLVATSARDASTAVRVAYAAMTTDRPVTAVAALVARLVAAVAAYKLLGAAIGTARDQLQEMVAVADKASDRGVGGNFFQRFVAESNRLKVSAGDLEDALARAFDATKDKSPIELSEWETGKEKITEVEKALRVFNATGTQLQGLVLFRDAQNQEEKVIAVLTAMKELQAAGRNLESLQLGEMMFGAKFADNIRLGKTSAEQMLETMRLTGQAAAGIFSDEMISRAKEVDNRLSAAQNTLAREMRPTMDLLARQLLDIKNYWASIVEYMAAAFRWANQIDLTAKRDELARINRALETGESLVPGIPRVPENVRSALGKTTTIEQDLIDRRDRLMAEIDALEGRLRPRVVVDGSRGAGAAPTKRAGDDTEARDRFDSATETIEKRIATMNAETAAIDLGTAARERAKVVAELETVAKQVNAQAGKENTEVTEEQRATIERLADGYAAAAKKAEEAKSPLASFAREARDMNRQLQDAAVGGLRSLEDGLVGLTMRTTTFSEAVKRMADSVVADLLRIGIRSAITGPLAGGARSLFAAPGLAAAHGAFFDGPMASFAGGGTFTNRIVNQRTLFSYAAGGRFGEMGEAGPEAIVPLRRGAGGRLGVDASGIASGTNVQIAVINQTGTPVQASARRTSSRRGEQNYQVILKEAVRDVLREDLSNNGEISGRMAQRFGLDPTRGM